MYKLLLILKYLRKRRIAWVSLIAVMLCTTMVLVVISIMGGWLRMFENSLRGSNGDVIVDARNLRGFAYYPQLIERIEKLPEVNAAVPTISTFGLLNVGKIKSNGVQVYGLPLERIGKVNDFPQSLYFQHKQFLEKAAAPGASEAERKQLLEQAQHGAERPSFEKRFPPAVYESHVRGSSNWPGMIVGSGIIELQNTLQGKLSGRDDWRYLLPMKLVVMNVMSRSISDPGATTDRAYWIADDSHTGAWQYDSTSVYVDFDLLQKDLGMDQQTLTSEATGKPMIRPARCSQIHVALTPGVPLLAGKEKIAAIVQDLFREMNAREAAEESPRWSDVVPEVQTWREAQGQFIAAIENEKTLVVFLFSIISIVAIFLIFCIFYMIVAEKTRDIGIIKSVGASDQGVAAIFLGYGAAIGVVGGGLGLLCGYLIVHYINEIHSVIARVFGRPIWNPQTYAFDTIPNTINPLETTIIVSVAVLASIAGAAVPAYRASQMHPIEALRWE
jgi:lipoprotein-releasing system permease protein